MEEIGQLLPLLIGLGLLLLLSAFFSGSETALCALSKVQIERLRHQRGKSSTAIVSFVENPRRLFITILLGNTFVNTAFQAFTAYAIIGPKPSKLKVIIATITITTLLLVIGEISPKTYAIKYAEGFSKITARPLWIFSVLISPFRVVLRGITNPLILLFGGGDISQEELMTTEDFKAIVSDRDPYSGFQLDEQNILKNILEMQSIESREIMVPRTEMIAMDTDSTIQDLINTAQTIGVSRIPVYRKSIDEVCGIFYIKDLPAWPRNEICDMTVGDFLTKYQSSETSASSTLIRPPFFTPETKNNADLLRDLTKEKTKMAILLDEYGGISGLVTVEDIIEEIIGDIIDEHDIDTNLPKIIHSTSDASLFEVSGRVSIRQLNERFHLGIDETTADTVGGYAFDLFGRIPLVGEKISNENGIEFEVAAINANQISVVIMKLPPEEDN